MCICVSVNVCMVIYILVRYISFSRMLGKRLAGQFIQCFIIVRGGFLIQQAAAGLCIRFYCGASNKCVVLFGV